MTQIKTKIPAELEPAAVGGMVTDSKYVKDRVKNKTQEEVNADTEGRVSTLEESVGTGGSVDERIAVEKNRAEQAEGVLDGKVATEKQRAEGVEGGLNTRLQTVEELAAISVGGGDIGIGTAADFESDDPEDMAKVPTVGAMLGGANDGVYDISARHNGTKYADLAAALGTNGANIPESLRKGGMSVKFVQSPDNSYVQYRLMANTFTTHVLWWQGVDNTPTLNSDNLVKSGGVYEQFSRVLNSNDSILLGGILSLRDMTDVNKTTGKILKQDGSIVDQANYYVTDEIGGNSVVQFKGSPNGNDNVNFALYRNGVVVNVGRLPEYTVYLFVPYGYTMRLCSWASGSTCKQSSYNKITPMDSAISDLQQRNLYENSTVMPQIYDLSSKTSITFTDGKILRPDGSISNMSGYSVSDSIEGNTIVCIDSNSLPRTFTNFILYSPDNTIIHCDNLPNGKYFLFIPYLYTGKICTTTEKAANCYKGSFDSVVSINSVIEEVVNKLSGKKISWYGTSIPQTGYPQLVGQMTGAIVTNEAQGSSMARRGAKSTTYQDDPYKIKGLYWSTCVRGLMMSVAEKNDVFTNWLDYVDTWVGTYEGEQGAPTGAKPHDINDGQHEELKSQLRNMCYDVMIARHCGINNEYNTQPVDVSDIYVIEHAYNDIQPMFNDAESDFSTIPSDPYDKNHPIGAINAMIKYIYEKNSRAKIVLIGHYESHLQTGVHSKSVIEKVAEYWSIPLLKLYDLTGFNQNRISINGYWDTDYNWHESGFSFVVDGENWTSNNLSLAYNMVASPDAGTISGSTVSGTNATRLMAKLGITAGDGTATWAPTRQEVYLTDNLHPTAISTRRYFANIIAKWLANV